MPGCSKCIIGGRKTKKHARKSRRGSKHGGYQYKTPSKTRTRRAHTRRAHTRRAHTRKAHTKSRKTHTRKIRTRKN